MTINKLILHPEEPNWLPSSTEAVQSVLLEQQFIGQSFEYNGQSHFYAGDRYLQLISYLGCSPYVNLDSESNMDDHDACHVVITPATDSANFLGGDNVVTPRCPHCRKPEENWKDLIASDSSTWQCTHCGESAQPHQLNWRQKAGFARTSIELWGVFPSEAVPSDQLMAQLRENLGMRWTYFYYQGSA